MPDFLLVARRPTVQVVNVKPLPRARRPAVAEALAWPGPLLKASGWHYESGAGPTPVPLANLRFLAATGDRPAAGGPAWNVLAAVRPGDASAACKPGCPGAAGREVKAAVLSLPWQQRLATDLHGCLDSDSTLELTA